MAAGVIPRRPLSFSWYVIMQKYFSSMSKPPVPVIAQFSEVQRKQVIEWYNDGLTQQNIADNLGQSRRTIMKLLKQLEKEYKISLKKSRSEVQKQLPDEIILEVKRLRLEGMSLEEIARATNKSVSSVFRICKKLDLGGNVKHKQIAQIDIDELYNDYREMDLEEVEKKYNISSSTIYKKLHEANKFVPNSIMIYDGSKNTKPKVDHESIISEYKKLGSLSKVANLVGYSLQGIKNVLTKAGVLMNSTEEIMKGENNPFWGKTHDEEVKKKCIEIGKAFGKQFWIDNPEYVEVVRLKNKEYWADLERRREDSLRISLLRAKGKCNPRKGMKMSRFGAIPFDSSYEEKLIEYCEADPRIVDLERDFMLIEYDYDGMRHYIPDFRIWFSNGDFLVLEMKSDWYAKQPKEQEKIKAGFIEFADKYMVLNEDIAYLGNRIDLIYNPLDFDFNEVIISDVDHNDYINFYSLYHYKGKTGRRGPTLGAYINDRLIACATISSITRNETAKRHKMTPSEVRELVRFCIHPEFHKKNFGSWFMARVLKDYAKNNKKVKMVVSFADSGHHLGTLYLAANWTFDGTTGESYHYVNKEGNIIHKRTVWLQAIDEGISESAYAKGRGLIKVREKPKKRYYKKL